MTVTAIVGAQWGDEGKGKITDLLAQDADLVVRYGGGGNAGHTVINEYGEFALHHIPCGIFNPGALSLIGTGAVVDFDFLIQESAPLIDAGLTLDALRISSRCHVVMPYHLLLDRLGDQARGAHAIGTTYRGVGPAYADKAARVGIQAYDILDPSVLRSKLELVLPGKNRALQDLYAHPPLDLQELMDRAGVWRERFGACIVDQVPLMAGVLTRDGNVLLEGQLGTMRDLDWGMYPYVTSSTTISGGVTVGGGVPPTRVDRVIGVVKAYTSAVGAGPLPTELQGAEADDLRTRGAEYGVTTGRPRRVGWFDAVASRYSCQLNQFESIAITKLDVLDGMPSLRICTSYDVDGVEYVTVPPTPLLARAVPRYEELPGWDTPTAGASSWDTLPVNARRYVRRLEELVGARASLISVGPGRNQTILAPVA